MRNEITESSIHIASYNIAWHLKSVSSQNGILKRETTFDIHHILLVHFLKNDANLKMTKIYIYFQLTNQ